VLVQVIFHSRTDDVEVVDVVTLEPAIAFGERHVGAPLSLALRIPADGDGEVHDASVAFDRWAGTMAVVDLELGWIEGDECLMVTDLDGSGIMLQIIE
jgi:hypothetical protein